MRPLVLRGGRVIDPLAHLDGNYDLLLLDGKVNALERPGSLDTVPDASVVDCAGLWVVPGLIDPHVHLRDPGAPEKETITTGLRAAAAGGFTAVAAMANTSPVNDNPATTRYMVERASEAGAARLIPVAAVTKMLGGKRLVDFTSMADAGARLFSDDGIPIDDEVILSEAFDAVSHLGFAISLHEEDRTLTGRGAMNAGAASKRLGVAGIPVDAENKRIRRDVAVAMGAEAAVHIAHLSTGEALRLVRAAKKRRVRLTCEVTPHHFTLDDSAVLELGPNARMAPPLRSRRDVDEIRAGIADGTIDIIATDHAPHDSVAKKMNRFGSMFVRGRITPRLAADDAEEFARVANGVIGLETSLGLALGLVRGGIIDPPKLVEMMSLNPARLLRLDDVGTLRIGAYADVTLIDPNHEWTVDPARFLSKSRNTPFAGMNLIGKARATIVAGEIVYEARVGEIS